jgi:glycosyltransferase involved in cell wall biosynthesis
MVAGSTVGSVSKRSRGSVTELSSKGASVTPVAADRHRVSIILHKFDRGGSLRVAAYLARGFTDMGMDVDLIAFTCRGEVETVIVDLMGADIPVRYLGAWRGPRPFDLIRGLPRLVRILRARRPDTIIAAANNTALVSAAARLLAGLDRSKLFLKTTNPIVSSRHTGLLKRFRRWSYARIFPGASEVWTLSVDENDEMRAAFPAFADRFRAIINPYVTPAMLALPAAASPHTGRAFILGVGRLTGQKRYERLIEAFALIKDKTVDLRILGEGEERAKLTALIARLGLQGRVSMPGYVTNVAEAFHAARLFVLPSDYEGLPAVVLEAMAANCPVLCTDCFPAARSILTSAEGCAVIEDTAPAALAALIDTHLAQSRPIALRAVAERYSIANGVASHAAALLDMRQT